MSISSIITALQVIHAAISGVTTAPTTRPLAVETASLPCVLLRPGALALRADARAVSSRERVYEGLVLVESVGQSTPAAAQDAAQSLMEALADRYETMLTSTEVLSGSVAVAYADGGDAGLIEYGGREYLGFTISITVWEG